MNQH